MAFCESRVRGGYSADHPIVIKIGARIQEAINTSGAGTVEITGLKNDKF